MKYSSFLVIGLIFFISFFTIPKATSGNIPPFRITQLNGKSFRAENIPFGKPILIVYFSPDCDDCLNFINSFFDNIKAFDKAYVVMISYLSLDSITKIYAKYKIGQHGNIAIGVEGVPYFVRNYYNITALPFVALYDKNGKLISSYAKDIPLFNLISSLKTIK